MRLVLSAALPILMVTVLFAHRQIEGGELRSVMLIDKTRSLEMKDAVASRRGRAGVMGGKQYYVFAGPKAELRTQTPLPVFQFDLDGPVDNDVYLFRFDKKSDAREIKVAQGSGLTEIAIPKDHLIATTIEEVGAGRNSAKRYRLKPTAPLRPGEYCLSRDFSVCFDFGVD